MTIGNALNFIKNGQTDGALGCRLVKANGYEALEKGLSQHRLRFSPEAFEGAYSVRLFKCQKLGCAESLMAFKLWWTLPLRSNSQENGQ